MTQEERSFLAESYKFGKSALGGSALSTPHKFYLFGSGISHSLAPVLHNTSFRTLNIPWTYELFESTDRDAFLALLHAGDCIGSAVTMPNKVTMIPHVDAVTEEGRLIGAINTIFVRLDDSGRKRYIGTNTDCIGIYESFVRNYPDVLVHCTGKPAMVLGGGGACRSAVYAVWKWMRPSRIYLVNRLKSEVTDIIKSFTSHKEFDGELVHVETVEQAEVLERPVIVVGTIPDFPPKEQGEIQARKVTETLIAKLQSGDSDKGFVLEMCYHPNLRTAFYGICEKAGWEVILGTEAMIYQGIAQEELWTEKPSAELNTAVLEASKAVQNALNKG